MDKTLFGISLTNSQNNIPEGIKLAERKGNEMSFMRISKVFVSPLPGTRKTAEAVVRGLKQRVEIVTVPVAQIGSGSLFCEIVNDKFRCAAQAGISKYDAIFKVHDKKTVDDWARIAYDGLVNMFSQLQDGAAAAAYIDHSPMIELAAGSVIGLNKLALKYRRLAEMSGIMFIETEKKIIRVEGFTPVPAE